MLISTLCLIGISAQLNGQIETKITASDGQEDDNLGVSVAIHESTAVVGAYGDDDNGSNSGSVYVYNWDGCNWIETKLTASDGEANDRFGEIVDISGDRIVVGVRNDSDNTFSGSVYIYEWDGSQWQESRITASDGDFSDNFGRGVSIDSDRIVAGALYDDDNGSNSGSAYIFDWDGSNWVETKITASDGAAIDEYGRSVAVSGDRVVVGAGLDDDNGTNSGSVYVYDWNGSNWAETKITASDGAASDLFGEYLDVEGDRIVVGARRDDDNGPSSGSVYVYDWDGSNWTETKIVPSDGSTNEFFGQRVALYNDRIVVGLSNDDDSGTNSGSVYVYDWNGTAWIESKITASDASDSDNFGSDVSVHEDRIIAGAYFADHAEVGTGSVYLYDYICSDGTQLNQYNDAGSGLWTDPANWSLNEVPSSCHEVIIPSGHEVIIPSGASAACFTIDVQGTAQFHVVTGGLLKVLIDD